jgi:acyl-coenzyme A thioesterase PaaI-like protein
VADGDPAATTPAQQPRVAADELGSSFDRDTAVRQLSAARAADGTGELTFAAELSPAWQAMRGPHGGYLAAIMLRALVVAAADESRAPRSLTVHYARAPEPGQVRIRTRLERGGRSLSTLSARMEQDGALVALATAAFSVPWSAPEITELRMPDVAAPDPGRASSPELSEAIEQGLAPVFLRQLIVQRRIGGQLFAGSQEDMEVGAWLGLLDPMRSLDAVALAMLSDVGVPPPLVRLREPALASTVDLTVHFRTRTPLARADPGELCFAQLRTRLVHEGFFEADGVIWAPDATVLAQSRQLAVLMALPGGPRSSP